MRLLRLVGVSLVLAAACSDDTGSGGAATTASTSAAGTGGATTNASNSQSASASDSSSATETASASASDSSSASTSDTSSSSGDGSSSSGVVICDADGDLAQIEAAGCCETPGQCDCDDNDLNVYPGQMGFFTVPRPFGQTMEERWDYNCDGNVQKQYPFSADPCAALGLCNASGYSYRGMNNDYECGGNGTLTNCVALLGSCDTLAHTLGCH